MNFEYYRNFVEIVKAGSISEASRILFIAQPALSNQIKALETEYGTPLLKRGSRRLDLTDAGKFLFDKAVNICYLESAARKEINSCVQGQRGTLRLGLTHATPDPYFENLLLSFHNSYPGIQYDLSLNTSEKTAELLETGVLDIGFLRLNDEIAAYMNVLFSIPEKLMAYYTPDNPWIDPDIKSIDIAELKGVPIAAPFGLTKKLDSLCSKMQFSPYYLCIAATRGQAIMWSLNQTAVTLLICSPHTLFRGEGLCSCEVTVYGEPVTAQRAFVTYCKQPLSTPAKVFLDFSKNYYTDL